MRMFAIAKEYRILAVLVLTAVLLFSPVMALGQGLPSQIVPKNCTGADAAVKCGVCDVAQLAQNLLNTGIFLAVFFSALLFAWAGWKVLTSGGDTEAYTSGKRIFTNVAIGLIIILAAWLLVDTLMKALTGASFGPWNKVCEAIVSYFDHHYA